MDVLPPELRQRLRDELIDEIRRNNPWITREEAEQRHEAMCMPMAEPVPQIRPAPPLPRSCYLREALDMLAIGAAILLLYLLVGFSLACGVLFPTLDRLP